MKKEKQKEKAIKFRAWDLNKVRLIIGGKEIGFRRNISLYHAGKIIEYIGFVYHNPIKK